MSANNSPDYRGYSEAHRTLHDIVLVTTSFCVKDALKRRVCGESKILLPEEGIAFMRSISSKGEENGGISKFKVEKEFPEEGSPARYILTIDFYDSSRIFARMSHWLYDRHCRVYCEAVSVS